MSRTSTRGQQMRVRIAQEAARLMAREGVKDFQTAKRKAAEHLGAPDTRNMPRNIEVEEALDEFYRLFEGESRDRHVEELRRAAVSAMQFFDRFKPRLVGSVLRGTAGEFADINLHLFADTPEEVRLFLMEAHIPFEDASKRLRVRRDEWRDYPAFLVKGGQQPVELVVFPLEGQQDVPRSTVDGKPMQRASLAEVQALLAAL